MAATGKKIVMMMMLSSIALSGHASDEERTVENEPTKNPAEISVNLVTQQESKIALPPSYLDFVREKDPERPGGQQISFDFSAKFEEYSEVVEYQVLVAGKEQKLVNRGHALSEKYFENNIRNSAKFRENGTVFALTADQAELKFSVPATPNFVGPNGLKVGVRVVTVTQKFSCEKKLDLQCKDAKIEFIQPNIDAKIFASTETQNARLEILSSNVDLNVYGGHKTRQNASESNEKKPEDVNKEKGIKSYRINPIDKDTGKRPNMTEFSATIIPEYRDNIQNALKRKGFLAEDVRYFSAATPDIQTSEDTARQVNKFAEDAVSKLENAQNVALSNEECDAVRVTSEKRGTNTRNEPSDDKYNGKKHYDRDEFGRRKCYGAVEGSGDFVWYIIKTEPWRFAASGESHLEAEVGFVRADDGFGWGNHDGWRFPCLGFRRVLRKYPIRVRAMRRHTICWTS